VRPNQVRRDPGDCFGDRRLQHLGGDLPEESPLLRPVQTPGVHRDEDVGGGGGALPLEAGDELVRRGAHHPHLDPGLSVNRWKRASSVS
jgi:hypothetical protein